MPDQVGTSQVIRFATFEVDLQAQELRKAGLRLKLSGQPFQVLAILLEQPGVVVTREDLQKRLWPDTFVDVDHNLNTAINKIREALGDSAENPKFVETLPRRGYRFIGQIEGTAPVETQKADYPPGLHSRLRTIVTWTLAVSFIVVAVFLGHRQRRPPHERQLPPFSPQPFTALPGIETAPAFSPDGSRITFAWNGDTASYGNGFDLYVKAIGSETMLRLTQHPSGWLSSVWSPDGTQIAFHRLSGPDTGIYVVPALGGPERKLRSTRVPYNVAAPISWSPDGKWIAFGEPLPTEPGDRIFLLSLDTLATRSLPHDPKCRHDAIPTFSHSGTKLAYVCVRSMSDFELQTITLPDGTPKTVASFSKHLIGLSWTADDGGLIFSQSSGAEAEMYEAALSDGKLRRLALSPNGMWLAISLKGDRLAYSDSSDHINIWRKDLVHPELPAAKLISSTREQKYPQYSPDGKHIAFLSTRSGPWSLWMSDFDGTNLVQVSKLEVSMSHPRWSPDSKQIAFVSRSTGYTETYLVDISEQVPRKLISGSAETSTPSWSRDGKWIYYRSYEGTGYKIYRCPSNGGEKVLVSTELDAIGPLESFDGRVLYFAARELNALLKKISLERPSAGVMSESLPPMSNWSLLAIAKEGIYFVPEDAKRSVRYFDFTTKQTRQVFKVDKDFDDGLSVSSDGRYLLYTQVDEEGSDIMIADQFH